MEHFEWVEWKWTSDSEWIERNEWDLRNEWTISFDVARWGRNNLKWGRWQHFLYYCGYFLYDGWGISLDRAFFFFSWIYGSPSLWFTKKSVVCSAHCEAPGKVSDGSRTLVCIKGSISFRIFQAKRAQERQTLVMVRGFLKMQKKGNN